MFIREINARKRFRLAARLLASLWLLILVVSPPRAAAADLRISVLDNAGHAVGGVVLIAQGTPASVEKHAAHTETMDQRHMQFVPNVLVIQTGTGVEFPNSDQIQHQVYSFSPTKSFQLSLYAGHKYPPIIFDRPGLVTVGCNIHDSMIGYIYVTDSPFFGRSNSEGQLLLHGLPAGQYVLTAWHPLMQEPDGNAVTQQLAVGPDAQAAATATVHLTRPLRMDMSHMGDKRWADY